MRAGLGRLVAPAVGASLLSSLLLAGGASSVAATTNSISPLSHDFGYVLVGASSSTSLTVTVASDWHIVQSAGGGEASYGFKWGTCTGANGPLTCTVDETFTPTAPGAVSSHLDLTFCTGACEPADYEVVTVTLAGTGVGSVVISQVYGGGGDAGATLKHDFVELYNGRASPVDLTGWSVQYAGSTASSWEGTALSGTIPPGAHYLVGEGTGAGGTVDLPAPDAAGMIPMSASAGKVALVDSTVPLTGSCPGDVIDFVGYGDGTDCAEDSPTATLGSTTAALRKGHGAVDTDDNAADFRVGAPDPRNIGAGDAAPTVTTTFPANGVRNVPVGANPVVSFSEPVAVSLASFSFGCTSGYHTLSLTGGPIEYVLDPEPDLVDGDTCSLTVMANAMHDLDAMDPPDTMAADVGINFWVSADQTGPGATGPTVALRTGVSLSGTGIQATVNWSGADNPGGTGLERFELQRSTNGGATWTTVKSGLVTGFNVTLASTGTVQFRVRGIDRVGNAGDWASGPPLAPRLVQQASSAIRYGKTWTRASSAKYSGGSVKYAKAAGASATYKVTGRSIAFVTTRAASRGKVKIYVDGVRVARIDTYRARARYRDQAWARTWATSGTHTIKLVVVGTSGRPRIDLDAFAILVPAPTGP